MKKTGKLIIVGLLISSLGWAQPINIWKEVVAQESVAGSVLAKNLSSYHAVSLDPEAMKNVLTSQIKTNISAVVMLPMPDGSRESFHVFESPVMEAGLAAKYPQIKTYSAQGLNHQHYYGKLDITPLGFHAMIFTDQGTVFIDPYSIQETDKYLCYYKHDLIGAPDFVCGIQDMEADIYEKIPSSSSSQPASGEIMRRYKLALACTGEYSATKGGTKVGALSGMVTTLNRVDGIYETELSVSMVLIDHDDTLIYLNANTDPYTNDNGSLMLSQNQTNIDKIIGNSKYDIGHVFSTGGGGIAGLGVICNSGSKAEGVTGASNPGGDAFDVDFVAHEIGHEFGATHTFNSVAGSCSGNRQNNTAYEPGSGITIMGYAGICGSDNIANHSLPYFHNISFQQIQNYVGTGGFSCAISTPTNNHAPTATGFTSTYIIPKSTPFIITGSAVDIDNDILTYCWEEFDLGPAGSPSKPVDNAPLFRSFIPDTVPYRILPKLSDILNNTTTKGELLPSYARDLNFVLTVRDNRITGGGVDYSDVSTITVDSSGPFLINSFNTSAAIGSVSQPTVTWSVNKTDKSPVNCLLVNIYFSTDGGLTFPYKLASNTANDGSEIVTMPGVETVKGRFKVESVGNIFFDINNANIVVSKSRDGIEDYKNLTQFIKVYPNPATDQINLQLEDQQKGMVKVSLIDLLGKTVRTFILEKNRSEQDYQLNLEGLDKGIYQLQVEMPELITISQKIVKF